MSDLEAALGIVFVGKTIEKYSYQWCLKPTKDVHCSNFWLHRGLQRLVGDRKWWAFMWWRLCFSFYWRGRKLDKRFYFFNFCLFVKKSVLFMFSCLKVAKITFIHFSSLPCNFHAFKMMKKLCHWILTIVIVIFSGVHNIYIFLEFNEVMWPITAKSSNIGCSQPFLFFSFFFFSFSINCQYTVPSKYAWSPLRIPSTSHHQSDTSYVLFCFSAICWTLTVSPACLYLVSQWFVGCSPVTLLKVLQIESSLWKTAVCSRPTRPSTVKVAPESQICSSKLNFTAEIYQGTFVGNLRGVNILKWIHTSNWHIN